MSVILEINRDFPYQVSLPFDEDAMDVLDWLEGREFQWDMYVDLPENTVRYCFRTLDDASAFKRRFEDPPQGGAAEPSWSRELANKWISLQVLFLLLPTTAVWLTETTLYRPILRASVPCMPLPSVWRDATRVLRDLYSEPSREVQCTTREMWD